MSRAQRVVMAMLVMSLAGCNGYSPVRWPSADLWTPQASVQPTVQLPTPNLKTFPIKVTQQHVLLAIAPLNESRTITLCGLDLRARGVQPLLVLVENSSSQAYHISPRSFTLPVMPASRVARYGCEHSVTTVAKHVRWLLFLVPGVLFSSIIEPLTTFDFPGIHEFASRPARPRNRQVIEAFVSHELRDTTLQPEASLQGLIFVPSDKLPKTFTVTLNDAQTREPLIFDVTLPHETAMVPTQTYAEAFPKVWETVAHAAQHTPGWRVLEHDQAQGRLLIRKGVWLLRSSMATLQVEVRASAETATDVSVARLDADRAAMAPGSMRSVGLFFQQLDSTLKPPAPILPDVLDANAPATAGAY